MSTAETINVEHAFTDPFADGVFELPTNPGVWVRPLLRREDGKTVDVLYMTLEPHAQVQPETHPYSETVIVLDGSVECRADDHRAVTIERGEIWHLVADVGHHVINNNAVPAVLAMLIGV
jgi:quercetin dioxygenase-like cupin family protein